MTEHPPPEASRARTGTRGAHRAPRPRRGVVAVVAVVVAVVLALAGTAVALGARQDHGRTEATTGPAAGRGSAAEAAEVAEDLAGWIDAELPPDLVVSAPEELRAALVAAGVREDRMAGEDDAALRVTGSGPGAAGVVVARLPGPGGRPLSVVDTRPGEPTPEELDRRQRLAAAVLDNPATAASGRVAGVLRAAEVDARLLGLLAVLVARLDAGIADFPRAPGQPGEGTPARRVLLSRAGGEELGPGSAAAGRVRAFLAAQETPFAPDTVETTAEGVLIGFGYVPDPDAEVTGATR